MIFCNPIIFYNKKKVTGIRSDPNRLDYKRFIAENKFLENFRSNNHHHVAQKFLWKNSYSSEESIQHSTMRSIFFLWLMIPRISLPMSHSMLRKCIAPPPQERSSWNFLCLLRRSQFDICSVKHETKKAIFIFFLWTIFHIEEWEATSENSEIKQFSNKERREKILLKLKNDFFDTNNRQYWLC